MTYENHFTKDDAVLGLISGAVLGGYASQSILGAAIGAGIGISAAFLRREDIGSYIHKRVLR
jgi:outer membrane lipoprotein SlyB